MEKNTAPKPAQNRTNKTALRVTESWGSSFEPKNIDRSCCITIHICRLSPAAQGVFHTLGENFNFNSFVIASTARFAPFTAQRDLGARNGGLGAVETMDIILHLGAHRTGTTSFQTYLRKHRTILGMRGIGFWGPWRTRDGLLQSVFEPNLTEDQRKRGVGRLRMALSQSRNSGVKTLVVSDENMLGSMRLCLRSRRMYPNLDQRLPLLTEAFGEIHAVSLQIRRLDDWWASSIAYLIQRGVPLPQASVLEEIAQSGSGWRAVIQEISHACPDVQICVTTYDDFADRPNRLLSQICESAGMPPARRGEFWRNRQLGRADLREVLAERGEDPEAIPLASGAFMPFSKQQQNAMRETYSDDLFWLQAGAGEKIRFIKNKENKNPNIENSEARPPNYAVAGVRKERGYYDGSAQRLAPNC